MAKLAVLLITLFIACLGPAAVQGSSDHYCFNGWVKAGYTFLGIQICSPGSKPDPPLPSPSPVPSGYGLSYDYYKSSCPSAESIVSKVVTGAVYKNPGNAPGLIRLHFHDCFVRGCDASVLLKTTASKNSDTEREGPPNKDSLRSFEVIDAAKAAVEAVCPNKVSCADILAFAAADAAYLASDGRINIKKQGGRLDGRESFANETILLPGPGSNVQQLQRSFAAQGLTSDEMVTLSGAHTIGNARCLFVSNRTTMDPSFAADLKNECKTSQTRVNQDYQTPDVLDNKYYQNVLDNKVLFDSDDAIKTIKEVDENAKKPGIWEEKFEKAMENMGKIIDPKSRDGGEIRKRCWIVNSS